MKVLGILQNLWVKDPARVKAMMERHGRIRILEKLLFAGGLTGRRLMDGLGEEWCNKIVWEEASHQVGGTSGSVFAPDPIHVAAVIAEVKPDVILMFGKVAQTTIASIVAHDQKSYAHITARMLPHPAARSVSAVEIAKELKECLAWLDEQARKELQTT